jgi:hypothetical protein
MATRDLTSALSAALDDDVVSVFFAVDLDFDGDNASRIWTGYGTITIDGKDYTGLGDLLSVSSVEETSDTKATGATILVTGIPNTSNLALALTEPYQGRAGRIYLGVLGDTAEYTEIFSGFMDQMNITEAPDGATIEITLENKLVDLERQRVARYSSAYQKNKYSGDKGFDFVESLQSKEIVWGREVEK